jgi:plasmid stabilization system protein ParE
LIEAGKVYEQNVPILGAQFFDAVDEAVAIIAAAPERWRIVESDVRRFLIPRFPYAIYYRVHFDHVRILAFKHHSRHPEYWRERISD